MNNKDTQKNKFTRRAVMLGACKIGLMAGLFGRMFYLQIIKGEEFNKLAENNRIKTEVVPPSRGKILDRNNQLLALNQQTYTLVFEKLSIHSKEDLYQIALKIGDILKYDPKQQADLINEFYSLKNEEEIFIAEDLKWSQLVELELNIYDLQGVAIQINYTRYYPLGALFGHITGYVSSISEKEIMKSSISFYPSLKVGKNGVEKTRDKALQGFTGVRRTEVNAKGEFIREISVSNSVPGEDVRTTLDSELQHKVDQALGNNTGVILVSKLNTGEILACVSKPDFDPNLFKTGITSNDWSNLINNPELPLINRAVSLTYPPGSGFKINVAIAALKENFNPNTKFLCPGYHVVGDRVFQCWKKTGHGLINMHQAIAGSCNVYFWNVARIIGVQPFADIARKMGFGDKLLNDDLPREQSGIMPDPQWKKEKVGSKWMLSDTINAAIGQGYVEATPLQILTMVSRIATGKEVKPSIIKNQNSEEFLSLNLDKELDYVRKGMEMVVNSNLGTAYNHRITISGLEMAGKTGTCQVISKRHKDDDLSKENVMKKIRNHGIFVAYAPLDKPQYAFCGVIEHGGFPKLAIKIANTALTDAQTRRL